MVSLGKKSVIVRTFINGVETKSSAEERVVYRKSDGTFWVNWLSGRRSVVRLNEDTFQQDICVQSVATVSPQEFLGRIQGAVDVTEPNTRALDLNGGLNDE